MTTPQAGNGSGVKSVRVVKAPTASPGNPPSSPPTSEPVDHHNASASGTPIAPAAPEVEVQRQSGSRGRLLLAVVGVLVVANGFIFLRERFFGNTGTEVVPVQVPAPQAPNVPTQTPEEVPDIDINQSVVRRNAQLAKALAETQEQSNQMICSRTEYLLRQAQTELENNGTPIEVTLIRNLDYMREQLRGVILQTTQLGGSPEQSQTARWLIVDTQAILAALQLEYTNTPVPMCRNALAIMLETTDTFYGLAIASRAATSEQQLREAGLQFRQNDPTAIQVSPPIIPTPMPDPTPTPSASPPAPSPSPTGSYFPYPTTPASQPTPTPPPTTGLRILP